MHVRTVSIVRIAQKMVVPVACVNEMIGIKRRHVKLKNVYLLTPNPRN